MKQFSIFAVFAVFMSLVSVGVTEVSASEEKRYFYDLWYGIPEKYKGERVVRLKVTCRNGRWTRTAVGNPENGKISLSKVAKDYFHSVSKAAKDYLRSVELPDGSCYHGADVGSAFWFVESDKVLTEGQMREKGGELL